MTRPSMALAPLLLAALAALALGACGAPDDGAAAAAPAAAAPARAEHPTDPGGDTMFFKKKDDGLLAVGSAAPEFAVPDQDGKIRTLAEFRGKRVLLWFYPKADTGG